MGKSTPPPDFSIHVDGSCLTDSTDLQMPAQRTTSDQTVVHHDPEELNTEGSTCDQPEQTEELHHSNEKPQNQRERLDEHIEAQIQAAARKVVESLEREKYNDHNDSVLSTRTEESYQDGTELSYEGTDAAYEGTELTYDGTEATYESGSEHEDSQMEAVDELESQLDAHLEQALTAWEPVNEPDDVAEEPTRSMVIEEHVDDYHEDSSSHHDGDIDDDVFSRDSGHSQRSSINSIHDLNSSDEAYQNKLTSPVLGEEAATSHKDETISRVPSISSYAPDASNMQTPSKVLNRPPFRTPSSIRAIQMSSPTQSLFSSPRSVKRHLPTVSRIGTPNSQYSPSKRTPTRFKKKEQPLILLHVTVMPLQWPLAHAMVGSSVPESLQHVKESWTMLQDKLADTVLERGILLPHPQDSYEVLEERLLEALELPIRPRAQILKCGHYMGPSELDTPSSDDEGAVTYFNRDTTTGRKWCDICRKDVKLEDTGEVSGKRRFNLKIYASNGLMRAGAWAAAWREMERVDVEIEPWVEIALRSELEQLASTTPVVLAEEENDGFVDEEDITEQVQEVLPEEHLETVHHEPVPDVHVEEELLRMKFQEEEMAHRLLEEEDLQRKAEEESMRRKMMDEERMREIYGQQPPPSPAMEQTHYPHHPPKQTIDPDSLTDLLLATFKVLVRDKKNIAIGVLSVLVLFLALRPSTFNVEHSHQAMLRQIVPEAVTQLPREFVDSATESVGSVIDQITSLPSQATDVVKEAVSAIPSIPTEAVKEAVSVIPSVQPTQIPEQEDVVLEESILEEAPLDTILVEEPLIDVIPVFEDKEEVPLPDLNITPSDEAGSNDNKLVDLPIEDDIKSSDQSEIDPASTSKVEEEGHSSEDEKIDELA